MNVPQLIIAPAGDLDKNIARSVSNSAKDLRHLDPTKDAVRDGGVYAWGFKPGSAYVFDALTPGDQLLLVPKGDTVQMYLGTIIDTQVSAELASELWENGAEWPYVMFLDPPREVHVDKKRLWGAAGWTRALGNPRRVTDNHLFDVQQLLHTGMPASGAVTPRPDIKNIVQSLYPAEKVDTILTSLYRLHAEGKIDVPTVMGVLGFTTTDGEFGFLGIRTHDVARRIYEFLTPENPEPREIRNNSMCKCGADTMCKWCLDTLSINAGLWCLHRRLHANMFPPDADCECQRVYVEEPTDTTLILPFCVCSANLYRCQIWAAPLDITRRMYEEWGAGRPSLQPDHDWPPTDYMAALRVYQYNDVTNLYEVLADPSYREDFGDDTRDLPYLDPPARDEKEAVRLQRVVGQHGDVYWPPSSRWLFDPTEEEVMPAGMPMSVSSEEIPAPKMKKKKMVWLRIPSYIFWWIMDIPWTNNTDNRGVHVDLCSSKENHLLTEYVTLEDNGGAGSLAPIYEWYNEEHSMWVYYCHALFTPTDGTKFMEKACKEAAKHPDTVIVFIYPVMTNTAYYDEALRYTEDHGLSLHTFVVKGRVKFPHKDTGRLPSGRYEQGAPITIMVWNSKLSNDAMKGLCGVTSSLGPTHVVDLQYGFRTNGQYDMEYVDYAPFSREGSKGGPYQRTYFDQTNLVATGTSGRNVFTKWETLAWYMKNHNADGTLKDLMKEEFGIEMLNWMNDIVKIQDEIDFGEVFKRKHGDALWKTYTSPVSAREYPILRDWVKDDSGTKQKPRYLKTTPSLNRKRKALTSRDERPHRVPQDRRYFDSIDDDVIDLCNSSSSSDEESGGGGGGWCDKCHKSVSDPKGCFVCQADVQFYCLTL